MALVDSKPTTPSQRHLVTLNKKHLSKKSTIKINTKGLKTGSGRNHSGKITIRRKGGGHKKKYRKINFYRTSRSTGIVISLEHDPNRNTNLASIFNFTKNNFFYMLAPRHLGIGDIVKSGLGAEPSLGNSLPLSKIPEGSFIHNISLKLKKKSQLTRAAGTYAVLKEKTLNNARIKISSKEEKTVSTACYATLGLLSNESYYFTQHGKAGRSRWLNKRPKVRGVAMNPVDHPHGGGEGKKSGKRLSPWGKPAKTKK